MKKYNIGLDIGTTSVGWAVVETNNQKIIKKGNKRLWGVRLFDEASTAAERRSYRSIRRRYDRRRQRIKLLQEEFDNEINKVDRNFYCKLQESFYNEKDTARKSHKLSDLEKKQIKEYYKQYPTIYHLRNKLVNCKEKMDIRLVYLAIHHIIKYRGNFLYSGSSFNIDSLNVNIKIRETFEIILNLLPEYDANAVDIYINVDNLTRAMMNSSKNDSKILIKKELEKSFSKDFISEFVKMSIGNTFDFGKLLSFDTYNDKILLSFNGQDYDDKYDELASNLGDNIEILNNLKELYDMIFLKKLFKGSNTDSVSSLMIEKYNIHKKDLTFIKSIFVNDRVSYNKILRTKNSKELCSYDLYINNKKSNAEFISEVKKCFVTAIDTIKDKKIIDEYEKNIKKRMDDGEFVPRVTDSDNGKYPYQLNKVELIKIINNQGKYYPFLFDKTNDGVYKIVKLLEFKIPYYIGPLTNKDKSSFAWMLRKIDNVKITPYNFDEVVDKEKTAEMFIKRMISHCTYLLEEPAMPSNSILYSKYKVINELKQIKICGDAIDLTLQQKIFNELFLTHSGSINEKLLKDYIISCSDFSMYHSGDIIITGYSADKKFANNMQSYIDFFGQNGIFQDTNYVESDAEEIIEWITIFEDKDILEEKVRNKYKELSDEKINIIMHKKYKGWSSLSKKLLTFKYYVEKSSGIKKSIMDLMIETKNNFMQIINNDEYNFQNMISLLNNYDKSSRINYKLVDNLATSSATKRGIYQSLKIVDELVQYIGHNPEAIVIEMARGEEKKQRKDDRKKYLLKLYDSAKKDIVDYNNLIKELDSYEDYKNISAEKLFLYFIQEGKSLYSGRSLNIDDLADYEIDHIIPRTLIKDDSIDNKALVFREENQIKASNYVLPEEYRSNSNKIWWNKLKKNGLISSKKFYNLCRNTYDSDDIKGFINRQLVETRQITKHVANILSNFYNNSKVIYLPANLSHNYREKNELFKFREINDYHHAHDAYLAAVLGEYKENYLKKNISFDVLKQLNKELYKEKKYKDIKYGYVINSLDNDVNKIINSLSLGMDEGTGEVLFDVTNFNNAVKYNLYCNDIIISRKTEIRSGKFYKETLYKKGCGNVEIKNGLDVSLYGGYSNSETGYLVLVKYNNNLKIIGIPLLLISQNDSSLIDEYVKKQLKLKENEQYMIIKDKIPYNILINYKNQDLYIKGYSISNGACELSNARQLVIDRNHLIKWKYLLNKILNNRNIPKDSNGKEIITYDELINDSLALLNYLIDKANLYPLFQNDIINICKKIDFLKLNFEELSKIIYEIFKLYHCNSQNANLKQFGLGDRIGRLSGKNISYDLSRDKKINCDKIYNNSITGIKRNYYEL